MACCETCEKIIQRFISGYHLLPDKESELNLSYDKTNEDLKKIRSEWEALKTETASQIKETEEFFTKFTENEPKESQVDIIVSRAKPLEEKFRVLLTR